MSNLAGGNKYSKRSPSKPGRISLVRKEFDNLIEDQGTRVKITPSILCPNRDKLGSTNHVLDCPVCSGDEAVDITESAIEDWAYIQSVKLDKQTNVQGIWDLKDATITVQHEIRLYYWYKIEILDFASVYNQIIKKEAVGVGDRLRYVPATVTTDTPYYLIDNAGVTYAKDKEYKITDQTVVWRTGFSTPTIGSLYSLAYPVRPTFRILELIHDNRYYYEDFKRTDKVPIQMPQQAVMRWDYLANGSGSNTPIPTGT